MKNYKAQDAYLVLKAFGLARSLRTVQRLMASGELLATEEKGSKGGLRGQGHYYVVEEVALKCFLEEQIPYYASLRMRHTELLQTLDNYEKTQDEHVFAELKEQILHFLTLTDETETR